MNETPAKTELIQVRLDKWLWAARFYKTRSIAAKAVSSGKVLVRGNRAKPAKLIQVGDSLTVQRGMFQYAITIEELNDKRRSAPEAQKMYRESEESKKTREDLVAQLKAEGMTGLAAARAVRPNKKQRRQIVSLKLGQ
ncbi:MAG: RNA-binding protein [Deltaproteobacteria bacterium]|nr:RNA-binding protein [Deltaproteobacteria bacterium]